MRLSSGLCLVLFLAVTASACGPKLVWRKPGGTEAGFNKDRYECQRFAVVRTPRGDYGTTRQVDENLLFDSCMQARGYQKVPE